MSWESEKRKALLEQAGSLTMLGGLNAALDLAVAELRSLGDELVVAQGEIEVLRQENDRLIEEIGRLRK